MKKVYLMIYDAGGGHRSTANALQKVMEERQLPWCIHVVEVFKEIIGTSDPQNTYNNLVLKKKWIRIINEPLLVPIFKMRIRLRHSNWLDLLKRYWREHQPDMVVSLLPFVNRVLCESLQATLPEVPFFTVLTDLADCPPHFWIEQQEQLLICPTQRVVEQAKKLGYGEHNIFLTSGLVINPRFYKSIDVNRQIERQRLDLAPDLPTGLVMFGDRGSKEMLEIAQWLEESQLNLQLIFICGCNEELARTLRQSQSRLPRFVETFTSEIPYYMYLSDFFIGKPGNVSISEAVAMKLPVITECNALTLMQERYCCQWIVDHGVGIVVSNFRDIDKAVGQLLQPENLPCFQANTAAIKNEAVFEVVDILKSCLERPLQRKNR